MRVLYLVKTSDGARWAARQAQVVAQHGIQLHVALPDAHGEAIAYWEKAGVQIHILDCSLPVRSWSLFSRRAQEIKKLVSEIKPDIIHSHFVTTTLMLRLALGRNHHIPRLFQVPGPLHLEHWLYRTGELATAGPIDYWIASSQYTERLYLQAGVPQHRVYLSYYGMDWSDIPAQIQGQLRTELGLAPHQRVIGNINYMYPPKYFLGQTAGIKRHEDIIDALGIVCRLRQDVVGVLVGGQWGKGTSYERRLHRRSVKKAGDKIRLTGRVSQSTALSYWTDFDMAVHVPISENCGGVAEPLALGIPVIASRVGGLPEIVIDGITGWLVPACNPAALVQAMLQVLDDTTQAAQRARLGRELALHMFDVNRTGSEIVEIYQHVLGESCHAPEAFDSNTFLQGRVSNLVSLG